MTRQFEGAGLGLAVSKQLLDMMNGQMGVESEVGRGSKFWFVLPLRKETVNTSAEFNKALDLDGVKVLVIGDNPTDRRILAGMLDSMRCGMRNWMIQLWRLKNFARLLPVENRFAL